MEQQTKTFRSLIKKYFPIDLLIKIDILTETYDVDNNTNSTTIQKLNTDVWVTNDVKNYDYMETFKKITENLKNIITCILNELRPLFSYSY